MANLSISEARGLFNRELVAIFDESKQIAPKQFLSSFFTKKVTDAKEVSIQVRRGTERVAVDVLRGTDGNRNTISRHSEKLYVPPFYNEYFDATELDKYDLLFGSGSTDVTPYTFNDVLTNAQEKLMLLRYKMERAYELQASQVLESGIVQLKSGDSIDFGRKATSMVDLGQVQGMGYWNNQNTDPAQAFIAAGHFLRQVGKATDGVFNVIMGENALAAWKSNRNVIQTNYNIYIKVIDLNMPQANAEGGLFHGQYAAGSYLFNIWSYPEIWEDASLTPNYYIDPDHAYFIPVKSAMFVQSFAGVPAIIKDVRNADYPELITNTAADYVVNNYIDPKLKKHVFELLSAGLMIPVSVDRIYSVKATNGIGTIPVN